MQTERAQNCAQSNMRLFSHCKKAKLLLWPVSKSFTHRLSINFSAVVPSLQVPLRNAWSHQLLNCCYIHIGWGIGSNNSRPIRTNTNILCAICLGAHVSVFISIWSSLQGISVFTALLEMRTNRPSVVDLLIGWAGRAAKSESMNPLLESLL